MNSMKRIWGALFIGGLLFCLSFLGGNYIISTCKDINAGLEACADRIMAQEYIEAEKISGDLLSLWRKKTTLLSVVLGDSTLLMPSSDIFAIYHTIGDKNYQSALVLIRECQGYFEDIIDSERLSFGNIL